MASPTPAYIPHSLRSYPHLPPCADRLIRQVSIACLDLLSSNPAADASSSPSSDGIHFILRHISQLPASSSSSPSSFASFRTPQFSVLGLASLLLGISSTLMVIGSFAFMVGFMLIPFIFPVMVVACIGALHGALKSPLILDPIGFTSLSSLSSLTAVVSAAIFSLVSNPGTCNQKPNGKLD